MISFQFSLFSLKCVIIVCYDVCVLGEGLILSGLHGKQLYQVYLLSGDPKSCLLLTKKKGPSLMQLGCRTTRTASSQVETVKL